MANQNSTNGPPPFEDPFDAEDVEQRIYGTVLGLREPTTASEVADRVGCDPKTARKYLGWFADLGIVTRHEGRPATYRRNDAYFEWRRVDRLANEHSLEELRDAVAELTETISEYEAVYDAASPAGIDAIAAAGDAGRSIDDVYADLADWATAREERNRYERARRHRERTGAAEGGQVSG